MKFLAITLAATAASAAAVKRCGGAPSTGSGSGTGNTPVIRYDVTDFEASCIPHSSQCNYSFKVKQHASMETTGVSCSAQVTADAGNTLPAVTDGVCEESSRTWKIVKSVSRPFNLALYVIQPTSPSSNTTGVHTIQNDELQTTQNPVNPNGDVQTYIGPKAFSLLEPGTF